MSSVLITLLIISLHAVAAAGPPGPPGAGHVTTVNHAAPKAQPAPGKTPLALLASVGGAPQAGKRAPLARARAQHATAIKHAQLVHLHNRTRAELARRHRGANATNATAAAAAPPTAGVRAGAGGARDATGRPPAAAAPPGERRARPGEPRQNAPGADAPRRPPGGGAGANARRPPGRADATERHRHRRKRARDGQDDAPTPREKAIPAVFIALSGLALACFAAKAVFNAQSVDDAATPTSPAKARRVELREKLLRAQAVPPADAPPPPHQWSGGELDDDDVEVDAPSPVRLPEAPAAPRP